MRIQCHRVRRSPRPVAVALLPVVLALGGVLNLAPAAAASRARPAARQRVWLVVWSCRTRGRPFQPHVVWHRREVSAIERAVLALPRIPGPVPGGRRAFASGCVGLTWVRARSGRILLSAYLYPAEAVVVFDRSAHRLTASALDALAHAVPVLRRRPAGS